MHIGSPKVLKAAFIYNVKLKGVKYERNFKDIGKQKKLPQVCSG